MATKKMERSQRVHEQGRREVIARGGRRVHPDNRLADNILTLIGERDWSQTRLAIESGMDTSTLNSIINRHRGVTLYSLRRIRKGLGCTWDELLE